MAKKSKKKNNKKNVAKVALLAGKIGWQLYKAKKRVK